MFDEERLDPDESDAWAHNKCEGFDDEADNSSGSVTSNLQSDCSFDLRQSWPMRKCQGGLLPAHRRDRSNAHFIICDEKSVFVSFDIEIGGKYDGIMQISAELSCVDNERPNKSNILTSDEVNEVYREPVMFNRYDDPGSGVYFEEQCAAVNKIDIIWLDFCKWIKENITADKVGVLASYNDQNCNMKCLWKLTQAPYSPFSLPSKLKWFMDPYKVIT
ncbi:hypothetical protein HJC23_008150 [Cyclotella cryptica]|uniref:DNA polymerase epsilon catalytic subunit n=1 Tax=Cyclotella cryptica TaxID=29204 RepID=A0ABD3PK97_9STRA